MTNYELMFIIDPTLEDEKKEATVETGAVVQVPLFINQGDKIKIDTRTGEYLSRV